MDWSLEHVFENWTSWHPKIECVAGWHNHACMLHSSCCTNSIQLFWIYRTHFCNARRPSTSNVDKQMLITSAFGRVQRIRFACSAMSSPLTVTRTKTNSLHAHSGLDLYSGLASEVNSVRPLGLLSLLLCPGLNMFTLLFASKVCWKVSVLAWVGAWSLSAAVAAVKMKKWPTGLTEVVLGQLLCRLML